MLKEFLNRMVRMSLFPEPRESDGGSGGDGLAVDVAADGEILAEDEEAFVRQGLEMFADDYDKDGDDDEKDEGEGGEGDDDGAGKGDDDGAGGDDDGAEDDKGGAGGDDEGADDDTYTPPKGAPQNAVDGDIWLDESANKEYEFKDGKWYDADTLEVASGAEGDEGDDGTGGGADDFEDDVIPGLKGQDFAGLSEEARGAIATFYEESQKTTTNYNKIKDAYEILSKDPIAGHRLRLIQQGRALDPYATPEFDAKDIESILDAPNREKAAEKFKQAVKKYGQVMVDNTRLEIQRENAARETNQKGERTIFQAANLHPEVKHKIESFANVDDPTHPDHETYEKFTSKVIDYCKKRGWRYDKISEYEPEDLYMLVARREKWPVVFNAEDRDKELIRERVTAALKHFRRNRGADHARGMRQQGSNQDRFSDRNTVRKNGVDLIKLATSDEYHDKVLGMKPMDEKWIDTVAELRTEGEKIVERRAAKKNRGKKTD